MKLQRFAMIATAILIGSAAYAAPTFTVQGGQATQQGATTVITGNNIQITPTGSAGIDLSHTTINATNSINIGGNPGITPPSSGCGGACVTTVAQHPISLSGVGTGTIQLPPEAKNGAALDAVNRQVSATNVKTRYPGAFRPTTGTAQAFASLTPSAGASNWISYANDYLRKESLGGY